MPFVLDCSMTMSWFFSDEANEATVAVRDSLIHDHAIVPSIWPIEVANVMLAATRRGRIHESQWQSLLESLAVLPIHIDSHTADYIPGTALPLAKTYNLSVYDAVYLELALRHEYPLATLDKRLKDACITAGGRVL